MVPERYEYKFTFLSRVIYLQYVVYDFLLATAQPLGPLLTEKKRHKKNQFNCSTKRANRERESKKKNIANSQSFFYFAVVVLPCKFVGKRLTRISSTNRHILKFIGIKVNEKCICATLGPMLICTAAIERNESLNEMKVKKKINQFEAINGVVSLLMRINLIQF